MARSNTVLLVGGSLTGNAIRQLALEEAGYIVVSVLDASAAEAAARAHFFDAAVVDGYFSPQHVKDTLLALRSMAVPTVLIAPHWTNDDLKSLAHVHLPLQDVTWMTQLVTSVLLCPEPGIATTAPIGFGNERVRVGGHVAWLCANQEQVAQCLRFLEIGFEHGDRAIIAGDPQEHERLTRMLADHGFNIRELLASDKLQLLNIHSMIALGEGWIKATRNIITSAPCMVRILGCGSLRAPWKSDEEFFHYEEQVDSVIKGTRSIVTCLYEMSAISGKQLWCGGLGKHGTIVTPNGLHQNQRFITAPESPTG